MFPYCRSTYEFEMKVISFTFVLSGKKKSDVSGNFIQLKIKKKSLYAEKRVADDSSWLTFFPRLKKKKSQTEVKTLKN